jgi:hypothetical protein
MGLPGVILIGPAYVRVTNRELSNKTERIGIAFMTPSSVRMKKRDKKMD